MENTPVVEKRKVSLLFSLCILVFPFVSVWFLLRKGHGKLSRGIGFAWLVICLLAVSVPGQPDYSTNTPVRTAKAEKQAPPQNAPKNIQTRASQTKKMDLSQAKPYVIIKKDDFSFAGRDRYEWSITAPRANSFEERAQTAMKAAMDLHKQRNCHVANILLEISEKLKGKGFPLAMVDYAPDGYGYTGKTGNDRWIWRVEASGDALDPQKIKFREVWNNNKEQFRNPDGAIDEGRLGSYVAKKINIETDDFYSMLFYVDRKKYNPMRHRTTMAQVAENAHEDTLTISLE